MSPAKIPTLQTERLRLRPFEPADAPHLLKEFQDPTTSRYWFTPDRTEEEAHARFSRNEKHWADHGFGDWALVDKASSRFIGFCGLHHISGMEEVNLGYFLDKDFWGRGYGTEAAVAVVEFGLKKAGLKLIVALTHPDNEASIKILEKCGMKYLRDVIRNGTPRVVYSVSV